MRLDIIFLISSAALSVADSLDTITKCYSLFGIPVDCQSKGLFKTCCGQYAIDANNGCRSPRIPGMEKLCMDWRRERGHFWFMGQNKRCLFLTKERDGQGIARYGTWEEVICDEKEGNSTLPARGNSTLPARNNSTLPARSNYTRTVRSHLTLP